MGVYSERIIADGAIGYWRFGESAGTNANDETTNNRDGTYTGGYTLSQTGFVSDGNTAVLLNGSTGYIDFGDVAAFRFTGAFSIEIPFNTSAGLGSQAVLIGKSAWLTTAAGWTMFLQSGSIRAFCLTTGAASIFDLTASGTYNDGQNHWATLTWTGTTAANGVKLYIDGVLRAQATANAGTPGTPAVPMRIGMNSDGTGATYAFPGKFDEPALYSTALSAAQVRQHYRLRTILAAQLSLTIAGVEYATERLVDANGVIAASLAVNQGVDGKPSTCSFTTNNVVPTEGQRLIVTLGETREFAGTIFAPTQFYVGDDPANVQAQISASDDTLLLNRKKIVKKYTSQSATAIAQDIITTYCSGFTSANVAAALATVDEITFTNEDVTDALTRLAKRIGGYWYLDAYKDLHFFLSETGSNPTDLTAANASAIGLSDFSSTRDLSQVITRVYVEGGGGTAYLAAAVGATSLPVTPDTWYNAAGGTVVSGPQRITYTGIGHGYVPEPSAWHAQSGGNTTRAWGGLVWAPERALFVAVAGNSSSTVDVMTSPDGFTWTTRVPAAGSTWTGVAWAPSLLLFVAVSSGGLVMSSPDGITWTSRTAAEDSHWQDVVWSPGLSLFVAVANALGTGTHYVMTSPDGITWTARTAAQAIQWTRVAWAPALNLFAAVAASGTNPVMTSPDGINWTTRTMSTVATAIAWSPTLSLFVALAGTSTQTSPDGITWTVHTTVLPSATWRGIVWAEFGMFVAVGDAAADNLAVSADGLTWTLYTVAVGTWRRIAWSPTLGRLVAVGSTAGSVSLIMTNSSFVYSTLTGIPPSAAGSILYAILEGDQVNLLVQADDAGAQAVVAALYGDGSDGIIEAYLQDGRLAETEALARANAQLDLRSAVEVSVDYHVRDILTRTGRTIHVNLSAPTSVTGDFKIQQVTISGFHANNLTYPDFHVQASSTRFSLEELLREIRAAA